MILEEYLLKKYKKSSLNPYLCSIRKYLNFIQNKAETAEYKDILEYVAYLRKNENLQPKTIKHYLLNVKIYYYYLIEIGKRNDHPCSELYLKDKINKQIKVDVLYSAEILEKYLESHKNDAKLVRRRNEVITSLLIYQGLTVGEIVALEIEDINLEKAEIYIKSIDAKKLIRLAEDINAVYQLQRLGYVIEKLDVIDIKKQQKLVASLYEYLSNLKISYIPLVSDMPSSGYSRCKKWHIIENSDFESDL